MTKEEATYILRNTAWLGGNEQVKKVEEAIDTAERLIPNWIPCSERLPEYGESVLCYFGTDEDFGVNHIIDEEDGEWFDDGVTAWMPLPEPPYKENIDG